MLFDYAERLMPQQHFSFAFVDLGTMLPTGYHSIGR